MLLIDVTSCERPSRFPIRRLPLQYHFQGRDGFGGRSQLQIINAEKKICSSNVRFFAKGIREFASLYSPSE